MSFEPRRLSALVYAQGFTGWHYASVEPLSAVEAPGYFDSACDMIAIGDTIQVGAPDGFLIVFQTLDGLKRVLRWCEKDLSDCSRRLARRD